MEEQNSSSTAGNSTEKNKKRSRGEYEAYKKLINPAMIRAPDTFIKFKKQTGRYNPIDVPLYLLCSGMN